MLREFGKKSLGEMSFPQIQYSAFLREFEIALLNLQRQFSSIKN